MAAVVRIFFVAALLHSGTVSANEGRVTADSAYAHAHAGKLTLIDIRSPEEWRRSGVPAGALMISMHAPGGEAAFAKSILRAVGGDKSKPIAVICAVGVRSRWAQRFLARQGHTSVQDVSEGMFGRGKHLPGWIRRGLPIEACTAC